MATTPVRSNSRLSLAMERTGQWVFSQDIPADVVVEVCEATFSLHKFMLVAKSNYIRKMIMDSGEADLTRISLPDIPGGPETFEKAAKFCYGVNFEITVHNVAALRCAADYLQMTDAYCDSNLASRTEDFLSQVALSSLSGAVVVLKSCENFLPIAEDLMIVQRCVDVISGKACKEANFPSRSPPNWWTEELSILDVELFGRVITAMKQRGAKALTQASALITYADMALRELVRDHSGDGSKTVGPDDSDLRVRQRKLLESIVALFPSEKAAFPINFLCCLLRSAIFLKTSSACKTGLEKRISEILEHVTVEDLLVLSFTYDGERLFDLESVRRIVSGFMEKEKSMAVFSGGDFKEVCSAAMQRVAKTVDSYLAEIATCTDLSISKFNGIAMLVPKGARKVDDDLYRAVDIYLKAHQNLDEIEREKACSVMDPLKLSYEARVHASQNKRLPVQIVLHALYYDQLKLRSGTDDGNQLTKTTTTTTTTRSQLQTDLSLVRENEALRSELTKMKLYISDMQKNQGLGSSAKSSTAAAGSSRKGTFFSSMSKTLGKLNPFRHGSKDTSHLEDVDIVNKPRRRRFSVS
ncbi:root phototropism protein 2 [Tripterygium wilfordii]|uniref:Root phototropism protein 2 n=1 Tax=Tripterygium wilfordii TaxID=458696 RepID=A0A7J7DDR0_TRIWF|nr:root phototropism protein 2 [Tripterygium wilfordii]KAF5744434.1 root phototropism protein 2 [Tripterygium wilfordii]